MEAGVGQGQHRGQLCTSCMLGNAARFPSVISSALPVSISSRIHLTYAASTHHAHNPCTRIHTNTLLPPFHLLLCTIWFIPAFSPFSLSFSFSLSTSHTHSFMPISISFIFSSPVAYCPPLPPLHLRKYLTLICKWREERTVEGVLSMWFPSQVGNSGGTWG